MLFILDVILIESKSNNMTRFKYHTYNIPETQRYVQNNLKLNFIQSFAERFAILKIFI